MQFLYWERPHNLVNVEYTQVVVRHEITMLLMSFNYNVVLTNVINQQPSMKNNYHKERSQ